MVLGSLVANNYPVRQMRMLRSLTTFTCQFQRASSPVESRCELVPVSSCQNRRHCTAIRTSGKTGHQIVNGTWGGVEKKSC